MVRNFSKGVKGNGLLSELGSYIKDQLIVMAVKWNSTSATGTGVEAPVSGAKESGTNARNAIGIVSIHGEYRSVDAKEYYWRGFCFSALEL